jgi:hypothetical protein
MKENTMRFGIERIFFVMAALAFLASPAAAGGGACKKTSSAARKACKLGVKEDIKLGEGVCFQVSDPADSKECLGEVKEEAKETKEECDEVYDARLEVCDLLGQDPYDPELDPADFVSTIDNPYAPFPVGASWVYEGMTEEGDLERIEVTVLAETRTIEGIVATVISDIVTIEGEVVEDTVDWLAQDQDGNVWYLGEVAKNFENDKLADLEGSWETGENDAKAGYWMIGNPTVGNAYRQEFLLDEAEDIEEVIAAGETVTTPAGTFTNCIRTKDYTPLEPGPDGIENKLHCEGVGFVREEKPATGESLELIEFSLP